MKVGILGTGTMGKGLALLCASQGLETTLIRASERKVDGVREALVQALSREVAKGKLSEEEKAATLSKIKATADWEEAEHCQIVIESIVEDEKAKLKAFRELEPIVAEGVIVATNTSTLSVEHLACHLQRKELFLGLHFFNPPKAMALVEVVPTLHTSSEAVQRVLEFVKALKKEPVVVQDSAGFVVNRLLVPYLLDAIRVWESRTAPLTDVDRAMQFGCNYPMGPFALMDYIGLDIIAAMANNLYEEFKEPRFSPPAILKRLVRAGELGRKSKLGFYDYRAKPFRTNPKLEVS